MKKPIRVLVLQPLVSFRTLNDDENTAAELQPLHPHQGSGLASRLRRAGFELSFLNQIPWRFQLPESLRSSTRLQMLNARAQIGQFDVVLAYAEGGLKFITGSAWLKRPRMVPVLLTMPSPQQGAIRRFLSRKMYRFALNRASAAIYCLRDMENECLNRGVPPGRLYYAPTTVDTVFYDRTLTTGQDAPEALSGAARFLLAVGDSSRDDRLLYEAAHRAELPIVRVSRDPNVVRRVRDFEDLGRGDLTLSNVSFEQLRWLYSHATACLITSALDSWQAAGSTALVEAASCGAPCIIQSGGCLEREFRPLLARNNCGEAVCFVDPTTDGVRRGIVWASNLTTDERRSIARNLGLFARTELPIGRAHDAFADALAAAVSDEFL